MKIAERIKQLRKSINLTQKQFAERLGVAYQVIQRWEYGSADMRETSLRSIESTFNVNPLWLRHGKGDMFLSGQKQSAIQMQDDIIAVPIYDVCASAGYGAWVTGEAIIGKFAMPSLGIKRMTGSNAKNINLLYVKGDSMEPTLADGDLIAIDRSKTEATNGLFVARIENDLYVKRITFNSIAAILSSDNPGYPPITARYDDTFELIGRVIWFSRKIK